MRIDSWVQLWNTKMVHANLPEEVHENLVNPIMEKTAELFLSESNLAE